jgi:photosystem II stability/assembly factor-like uncharacterized protein
MRTSLFAIFIVSLCLACNKTIPPATPPPVTNPVTPPTTPVTPVTPPPSLDSLFGWTKSKQAASNIDDIWYSTGNVGFIINDTFLLTSTDYGVTWTKVPNTTFPQLLNFQFLDNQHGFVQGLSQLGVTTDGGANWSFSTLPTNSVYNFQFITPYTGFYYDLQHYSIYKTSDAGNSWQNVSNNNGMIDCFYFLDSLNGFYMGINAFNVTSDGAKTWQKISAGVFKLNNSGFYKMQFLDAMNGYCSSLTGLAKTTDGGISWTTILPWPPYGASAYIIPYFFDVNNGYCLMNNTIYKTTDGGQTWTLSCKLFNDNFSGLHMLDMNTGWAATFGGYVLRLQ